MKEFTFPGQLSLFDLPLVTKSEKEPIDYLVELLKEHSTGFMNGAQNIYASVIAGTPKPQLISVIKSAYGIGGASWGCMKVYDSPCGYSTCGKDFRLEYFTIEGERKYESFSWGVLADVIQTLVAEKTYYGCPKEETNVA